MVERGRREGEAGGKDEREKEVSRGQRGVRREQSRGEGGVREGRHRSRGNSEAEAGVEVRQGSAGTVTAHR